MRQPLWIWVVVGFVLVLAGTSWYIGRVNSTHPALWAMAGGDSGHRNYSAAPLPQNPKLLWSYSLGAEPRLSGTGREPAVVPPVVWRDGTVYAGYGTKVHAVGPDGKRKWAWESRTLIISIALGRQGNLYVLTDGMLYALKPDGTKEWEQEVDVRAGEARPLLVGQGGVIFVSGREYLLAVTSTGTRKWRFLGETISAGPIELPDGKVAVMLRGELYVLTRDGDTVWNREAAIPTSAMGLAASGKYIYVNARDRRMVFSLTGQTVAEKAPTAPPTVAPALGKEFIQDGVVRYGLTWADQQWTKAALLSGDITVSGVVDSQGNTVVLARPRQNTRQAVAGTLRMFDAAGEKKWEMSEVLPLSEVAPAGAGRLCMISNLPNKQGIYFTHLACIGDK